MPARITECRHEGCTTAPLDAAIFCARHIDAKRQCKATKAGSDPKIRCKKPALIGLEVCERHGGSFPQAQAQSDKAQSLATMARFTRPYEGDLNVLSAFEMEFRRTLGRIEWYDEQMMALKSAKDLIWGQTKQEVGFDGEGHKDVKTYEARANILLDLQWRERKHLLDMEKVWIGAGLEQQRLDLMKSQVARFRSLLMRALDAIGVDTTDPAILERLGSVFEEGEPARPQIDVLQIEGPR